MGSRTGLHTRAGPRCRVPRPRGTRRRQRSSLQRGTTPRACVTVRPCSAIAKEFHAALECETSRRLVDNSADVEFDASLVTCVATANRIERIGAPLLSRMHLVEVPPPSAVHGLRVAKRVVAAMMRTLRVECRLQFERSAISLIASLSPRQMRRVAEQALGRCLATGATRVDERCVLALLDGEDPSRPLLH